jgi:glycylpeptide N-tetradecanoyltransferase
MVEINFLCIHKKLRSKRLAPILIQEITRRVNLQNIWQALYTAGVLLPKPVSTTRYWHRSINSTKLISIGFSGVPYQFRKFKDPKNMIEKYFKLNAVK